MRLFVGLEISEHNRRELARVQDGIVVHRANIRWIPEAALHLTLKFLGEQPEDAVPGIVATIKSVAAGVSRFSVTFLGLGCFPTGGPVRVLWTGVSEGATQISGLTQRLDAVLPGEKESRFHPHVTLGRIKEDRSRGNLRRLVAGVPVPPLRQPVEMITLFSSIEQGGVRVYEAVHRSELAVSIPNL